MARVVIDAQEVSAADRARKKAKQAGELSETMQKVKEDLARLRAVPTSVAEMDAQIEELADELIDVSRDRNDEYPADTEERFRRRLRSRGEVDLVEGEDRVLDSLCASQACLREPGRALANICRDLRFTRAQRRLAVYRFHYEFTVPEISKAFDLSQSTIYRHLAAIRKRLMDHPDWWTYSVIAEELHITQGEVVYICRTEKKKMRGFGVPTACYMSVQ